MISKHGGLIMKYNTNSNGTPVSVYIENEVKQVSITHGLIQLEQIPDEFYRLQITDSNENQMYEVFNVSDIKDDLAYKVDYSHGIVYFHDNKRGESVSIKYYGRGMQLIHASRIMFNDGAMLEDFISENANKRDLAVAQYENNDINDIYNEIDFLKGQISLLKKQNELLLKAVDRLERGGK